MTRHKNQTRVEGLRGMNTLKAHSMNSDPIDSLLAEYSHEPPLSLPRSFQTDVWSEIQRRRVTWSWWHMLRLLEFRDLLSEPRVAMAAFALALVTGMIPAAGWAKGQSDQRRARHSLHFEIFAPRPAFRLPPAVPPLERRMGSEAP